MSSQSGDEPRIFGIHGLAEGAEAKPLPLGWLSAMSSVWDSKDERREPGTLLAVSLCPVWCMAFRMADDRNAGVQRFRSNCKHPAKGPV